MRRGLGEPEGQEGLGEADGGYTVQLQKLCRDLPGSIFCRSCLPLPLLRNKENLRNIQPALSLLRNEQVKMAPCSLQA